MTESIIRAAHKCIDREQWKPKQRGDKILVKSERWEAEIKGDQYDKEAVAKYLAAVSPENIAVLLAEMDELRKAAGDYKLSEDIRHSLVKLAYRVNMDMVQNGVVSKKEPAG